MYDRACYFRSKHEATILLTEVKFTTLLTRAFPGRV